MTRSGAPTTPEPFIALTDKRWFDHLTTRALNTRVDEVNFWSPKSTRRIKRFTPGAPVFFRLKAPHHAIAGYGFFAHFTILGLRTAWETFEWRNGDPDWPEFAGRIGGYRGVDLLDPRRWEDPLGCTILRDARFWPRERWVPWGADMGWKPNTQQGSTERDRERARILLSLVTEDERALETRREYVANYEILDEDDRRFREGRLLVREGQGTFRARLLDAYGRRCAITGERTEPVLDAAHIQGYLGPRSNHPQNGLLLTKEFHKLFDDGLVTVTPDHQVRVSEALRERWKNGRRYYAYDGQRLASVPEDDLDRPSRDALDWHARVRFLG